MAPDVLVKRVQELEAENQQLRDAAQKQWISLTQVGDILGMSTDTLYRWCAENRIDPRCGRKFGRQWRFRRTVIEDEGIVLK